MNWFSVATKDVTAFEGKKSGPEIWIPPVALSFQAPE
jgi:hypothetical protein